MGAKLFTDSPERRVHALATVPYLAELSQGDIKQLAGAAQLLHLRKGELLFQEGAACKGLHVIVAGPVKVFKLSAKGREQVLHVERDGALGEGPLLDGNPYPASAEAMETSVILFLPRDTVFAWCRRQPDIALGMARVLARRVRRFATLAEELALRDVEHRLMGYLMSRAEESGRPLRDGLEIVLTESNQDIADQIGTVREVVSRSLATLRHEGLISISGRRLTVTNIDRLRAAARMD
jgi:CRP-like cAMP-binding protein